jgi:TonB-linked SusC/RagA family outer membrane protein
MRKLLLASALGLVILLAPTVSWAQDGTITGTVTSESTGDILPGATVQVVGQQLGTVTDVEGTYRITDVPAGEQTILVTFVGFQDREQTITVPAGGTVQVDVTLAAATQELGEVTVTGYRTTRKSIETGASGSIDAGKIETADITSADQALQGEVAGVRVTSASGQPGSSLQVRVRGQGSITAGNDPLFVVDGVQISTDDPFSAASGNPLANISPSDIQNIEVLRDAAASSIYGAQAANGVVIITTKQGREGKTEINFSSSIGRTERLRKFDMSSTDQWADFVGNGYAYFVNDLFGPFGANLTPEEGRQVAFTNEGCPLGAVPSFLQPNLGFFCGTSLSGGGLNLGSTADSLRTDWPEAIYRNAYTQNYNLSVRGGTEDTRFYISGRFAFEQGQIIDSKLRQGGIRANVEHDVRDWLTADAKVDVSTSTVRGTISNGAFINSPFWAAYLLPTNAPIYKVPGDPSSGYNLSPNFVFTYNPVAQEEFNTRQSNNTQINASTSLNWTLGSGFRARTLAGIQFQDTFEDSYSDPRLPPNAADGGDQSVNQDRVANYNVSQTVTYDNTFGGRHSVSGLIGTEFKREEEFGSFMSGQGFPNSFFRTLSSAATPNTASFFRTEFRQLSFFGDLEYTYDQTYQVRSTLRYDGSSRFGQDRRYGLFGTLSGYWRISQEEFLSEADFLTDLKLRASYGVTGNSEIGNFQSRRLFGSRGEYNGSAGIGPISLGNNRLTWEEKREVNLGLDYAFFGGRVSGSIDAYRNLNDQLLLNRDLPGDSGFGSFIDNVGQLENRGLELSLRTVNIDRALQWSTTFNIAFQDSEVKELLPDDDEINSGGVYRVGEAPDQIELTPYAGVNPANGIPMYLDRNGNLTYDPTDTEDDRLVGNTNPDYYGGLTNQFSYNGLTAEVFFQYDYGRTTFNNDAYFLESNTFWFLRRGDEALDYWRQPGDVTDTPRPTGAADAFGPFSANGFSTTRWLEDASYIRLKRVRISYSMPSSVLSSIPEVESVNIYVQGRNLATWTNFTGFDPEVIGTALGEYPQGKTFSAGLNVTL